MPNASSKDDFQVIVDSFDDLVGNLDDLLALHVLDGASADIAARIEHAKDLAWRGAAMAREQSRPMSG